jgi:hypothetical protein
MFNKQISIIFRKNKDTNYVTLCSLPSKQLKYFLLQITHICNANTNGIQKSACLKNYNMYEYDKIIIRAYSICLHSYPHTTGRNYFQDACTGWFNLFTYKKAKLLGCNLQVSIIRIRN